MLAVAELKKLKVTELRDELASRGLDTKGVKDDLIARLAAAMEGEAAAPEPEAEAPAEVEAATPEVTAEPPAAEGVTEAEAPAAEPAPPAADGAAAARAADDGKPKVALAEADKQRLRAERFGTAPATGDKKGVSAIGGLGQFDPAEEFDRRKKRAERFGLPVPVTKGEEQAKKKQRAERFGIEVPLTKEEVEAKKKARADRFGAEKAKAGTEKAAAVPAVELNEEERKRREERAKRFAPIAS